MGTNQHQNSPSLATRWRRRLLWCLASVILLVGLTFSLAQLASPLIERSHPRIEAWLSRETGHQVQFNKIRLEWSVVMPVIVLDDFSVKHGQQEEEWLQVEHVQFAVDWWKSLIRQELRLARWQVRGVDVDLEHINPGGKSADATALFNTINASLGKNPITIYGLHIRFIDANAKPVDVIFDELHLQKQRGTRSQLSAPALKPWLQSEVSDLDSKQQKRLRLRGKLHLSGEPKKNMSFVIETAPFANTDFVPDTKAYFSFHQFPVSHFSTQSLPVGEGLSKPFLNGKAWVDIKAGEVKAVQSIFELKPTNKQNQPAGLTVGGHIYALKEEQKGWWITADKLHLKSAKHKAIEGQFALQYRDVKAGDIDWLIRIPQYTLKQGDAELSGMLQWHQPRKDSEDGAMPSPYLKSNTEIKNFPVQQILPLLPSEKIGTKLSAWLHHSIKSGTVDSASVTIDGRLNELADKNSQAVFSGAGEMSQAKLKYHHSWPMLTAEKVRFILDRQSLEFDTQTAKTLQAKVQHINVHMPNLFDKKTPKLNIQVHSPVDLTSANKFIQHSPLKQSVGRRLADLVLAGDANLALEIDLSLSSQKKHTPAVRGDLDFKRAGARVKSWPITINQLQGKLSFTERDLIAKQLSGSLWGEKVVFALENKHQSSGDVTEVDAKLNVALPKLAKAFPQIENFPMLGNTKVDAHLEIPADQLQAMRVSLKSDLEGVHVALPHPLGKQSAERRPTEVQLLLSAIDNNRYFISYAEDLVQVENNPISKETNDWNFKFTSNEIAGSATLFFSSPQPQIRGEFERLIIKQSEQPTSKQSIDPKQVPTLQIHAKEFQLDNKKLGELNLISKPTTSGHDIQQLSLRSRALAIEASGQWQRHANHQTTLLNGTFSTKRFKQALIALGISPSLESDKSRIDFSFNWTGAPYQFAMNKLNGSTTFKLLEGRVPKISKQTSQMIGLGRMLNLLSISSIPKRLRLDFSDITEKGLHFDSFKGKALIQNGVATSNDTTLEGPVARIRWRGRVGLAGHDYDLLMRVEPHMTSSLPVVAAIAGGPVVGPVAGVATWMMNKAIAPDIERLSSYTYKITGPWQKPEVQSVDPSRMTPRAPIIDKS